MADNVPITAGTGTNIATDDAGAGGHVQVIKLAISTDGSATYIPADTANGLDVDVTRVGGTVTTSETRPATATLTNVNDTASSTTLLSSTAGRIAASVHNDSTAILYLKFGTTASATSYTVKLIADAYYELPNPCYTGRIDGIWSVDASGAARITEITA